MKYLLRWVTPLFLSIGVDAAIAADCKGVVAWNADEIYVNGNQVQYNGGKYQAKWWTKGDNPAQSGQWDAWKSLGTCDSVAFSSVKSSAIATSSIKSSILSGAPNLSSKSSSSSTINLSSKTSLSASSYAAIGGRVTANPIGIENVNDSPMKASNYRSLLRFVPRKTISIDRFYFGFKLRGASCWDSGQAGYGAGDGGTIHGALVEINPSTGLPSTQIAAETVNGCTRHNAAMAEIGGGTTSVLVWVNTSAVLEAGKMYGFIVSNVHADPANNFFSFNMPLADTSLAGPHARNELNPNAAGALLSLDPREHVAWSTDSGNSWQYGSLNGQYRSYMNDHDSAHPATRMPQYGFRLTNGAKLAGQPYYAYSEDCVNCTTAYANAKYMRTFRELGAFTASGKNVGTLTITNTSSGEQSSCTPLIGYGFRKCSLSTPVTVYQGQTYTVHASGSVEIMKMDYSQRFLFPGVGTSNGELRAYQPNPASGTDKQDVPSIWAGPYSAIFPLPLE